MENINNQVVNHNSRRIKDSFRLNLGSNLSSSLYDFHDRISDLINFYESLIVPKSVERLPVDLILDTLVAMEDELYQDDIVAFERETKIASSLEQLYWKQFTTIPSSPYYSTKFAAQLLFETANDP